MIKYNKHILFSYKNRYNTSINNSIFKITARKFEVNNTKLPYLFTKKIRKILLNLILQDLKNQRSFVYLKSHKYSFLNITQDLSTTLLPIQSVLSNNFNYLTVFVKPSKLYFVLKVLKLQTSFQFSVLNFITSIDYPLQNKRFTLVYNLLSIRLINRITVKTCVDELTPLNSVYYLFPCSTWWEREVWDMFGIFFLKNKQMKRLLTDYGFDGFPLRKDYPLTGFSELSYDFKTKRVNYNPLEQHQMYRKYNFLTGW